MNTFLLELQIVGEERLLYTFTTKKAAEDFLIESAKKQYDDIAKENIISEKDLIAYLGEDNQNDYMRWNIIDLSKVVNSITSNIS